MAKKYTWSEYVYPQPNDHVLRNLWDIHDPKKLQKLEYSATAYRQRKLLADPSLITKTYDAEHLRAIHRYLFQDVYEWAGEPRTVRIYKEDPMLGLRSFADIDRNEIDSELVTAASFIQGTDWGSLDREQFATQTAKVYAHLNYAHPFREGNGRALKMLMHHLSEKSKFTLDFTRVKPKEWNFASAVNAPPSGKSVVMYGGPLKRVFRQVALERPEVPAVGTQARLEVSYPRTSTSRQKSLVTALPGRTVHDTQGVGR